MIIIIVISYHYLCKTIKKNPTTLFTTAFSTFPSCVRISARNLKRVAKELGERMTDEELQERVRADPPTVTLPGGCSLDDATSRG